MTHRDPDKLLPRLIKRVGQASGAQRRKAFEELYELAREHGAEVADAIPVLVDGLHDPDTAIGESALWALRYCAPDSLEPLRQCLAAPHAHVRERAAHALGNIGEEARAAAPALRPLLADADQEVRSRAAWSLGLLHDADAATAQGLLHMVAKGSAQDRSSALHAMGNIGTAQDGGSHWKAQAPLVMAALSDADDHVRRWALYPLESIGLTAQEEAQLLAGLLPAERAKEVVDAILARLKALAKGVDLSPWASLLADYLAGAPRQAVLACELLATLKTPPAEVVAALYDALAEEDVALSAAGALWAIEGERCAARILPVLEDAFEDDGESVCDLACRLGPAAAPLVPKLVAALSGEDWDLQWAAADALGAVASAAPEVLEVLVESLGHESPIVRSAAVRALSRIGTPALAALEAAVDDDDPEVSEAAQEAVAAIRRAVH